MATTSTRALWKGAISFGLVHIPVALHSAVSDQSLDFDWLDKRSMERVGYKRINKVTGKEIDKEDIVKGIEYEDGEYVVLSNDEIKAAYPKTTQTVEIEAFVSIKDIPFVYLERPYYISPINRGAKVFALLREVLHKTNKVGIAKVVIQTKQHLAVLMACGPALVLNLLRWSDEIRTWDQLNLPAEGTESTGLTDKEMAMGEQLVEELTAKWKPDQFTDSFRGQIMQLVKEKVEAGDTETVESLEEDEAQPSSARIYDLTAMLQQSLNKKGKASDGGKKASTSSKASEAKAKTKASKSVRESEDDGNDGEAEGSSAKKPAKKAAAKSESKAKPASAKKAARKTASKPARKAAKAASKSASTSAKKSDRKVA